MPSQHSLAQFTTLGLHHTCHQFFSLSSKAMIIEQCMEHMRQSKPFLILGGGSNVVFTEDYQGDVLQLASKGIKVGESTDSYLLEVEAGENWHELVQWTLEQDMPGLENLALIPGVVGAAPIQNIGAYGCELAQFCDWVEYLDLNTGELNRLTQAACRFGYRDSIFKQDLKGKAVITAVGLKLAKQWVPCLEYGPLRELKETKATAKQIFERVCQVRLDKLPDPAQLGNVGSFFKNPIVSQGIYQKLIAEYPSLVAYPVEGGMMKLAAGWLIDQAGLKGFSIGDASVHEKQALVLVNRGHATGDDIVALAKHIIARVNALFGVTLEAEPRIITAIGEGSL